MPPAVCSLRSVDRVTIVKDRDTDQPRGSGLVGDGELGRWIITLQRANHKSQFRIQWTKQLRPNEIQVGIEALDPVKDFWGVDISEEQKAPDLYQQFLLHVANKK